MKSLFPKDPPPGPSRPTFWRSPLRGRELTVLLSLCLLASLVIIVVTGRLSHAAYQPALGDNAQVPLDRDLIGLVGWPASPTWLYAATQGVHVTLGLVTIPLLMAKLWSVLPSLFKWPPIASPAEVLDRLSTFFLTGSTLFMFVSGTFSIQLFQPWQLDFVGAHYYASFVFLASLAFHIVTKVATVRETLATRRRTFLAAGPTHDSLRAPDPDDPSLSRRGLFGLIAAASATIFITTAGQSIGGRMRPLAVFAPRGRGTSFPVRTTAAEARITPEMVGALWRLQVSAGEKTIRLSREQLLAMPQRTYDLPIACVEGWSTTQRWTGVRLSDLAALVGLKEPTEMLAESLQHRGRFRDATLGTPQVRDDQSMLALKVNGEDLPIKHGYPARIVVPALPGVHCTKWVSGLRFT